ncbi:hypothetical protein C5B42_03370 [Candidatus Cerribacteria bacterium 'Amazon FNV 2010 28 9']|uniref:Uncharacterized protein n=1 Tax=Candidatus Cerribacteria bacterium 'Amazon FNV 2010 28 9' TaxID=2081795 RepID=A0A317JRB2_9BACT|nr:MAG: hypothetical protein C5B42_03370 [Candidatus Cerribacteria bacterium 'Amazon FNV 2010 28 9']
MSEKVSSHEAQLLQARDFIVQSEQPVTLARVQEMIDGLDAKEIVEWLRKKGNAISFYPDYGFIGPRVSRKIRQAAEDHLRELVDSTGIEAANQSGQIEKHGRTDVFGTGVKSGKIVDSDLGSRLRRK